MGCAHRLAGADSAPGAEETADYGAGANAAAGETAQRSLRQIRRPNRRHPFDPHGLSSEPVLRVRTEPGKTPGSTAKSRFHSHPQPARHTAFRQRLAVVPTLSINLNPNGELTMSATTNSLVVNAKKARGAAGCRRRADPDLRISVRSQLRSCRRGCGRALDDASVSSLVALDNAVEAVAARVTPAVVNVAVTSRVSADDNLGRRQRPDSAASRRRIFHPDSASSSSALAGSSSASAGKA